MDESTYIDSADSVIKTESATNTGSTLIIGGNIEARVNIALEIIKNLNPKLVNKDHPDVMWLELESNKKSIGIAEIRKVISFLSSRPYSSDNKIVVVNNAEKLTNQAQNSFLKILEEPPNFAKIILIGKNEEAFLSTVISRCRKINVKSVELYENIEEEIGDISSLDVGERLTLAEELSKKEKDHIINFLEMLIVKQREKMLTDLNTPSAINIEKINDIINDLENTNIGKRLALEYLFLHLS